MQLLLQLEVAQRRFHPLPGRGRRVVLPHKRRADLRKQPGIPLRSTGNQHRVAAGLVHHPQRVRAAAHVAVAEHRHRHALLHLPDDAPVRMPGVLLHAGAPVHRDGRRARLLTDLRHLHGVDVLRIPARANLHRHRNVHCVHHGPHDAADLLRVAHQRAALAVSGDLRCGTAEVEVEKIEACGDKLLRRVRHDLRIAAKQLKRGDSLPRQPGQQLPGVAVLAAGVDPALRGEHLAHAPGRALLMAQQAHGRVAHPRHWRERRARRQLQFSDSHGTIPAFHTAYPSIITSPQELCNGALAAGTPCNPPEFCYNFVESEGKII